MRKGDVCIEQSAMGGRNKKTLQHFAKEVSQFYDQFSGRIVLESSVVWSAGKIRCCSKIQWVVGLEGRRRTKEGLQHPLRACELSNSCSWDGPRWLPTFSECRVAPWLLKHKHTREQLFRVTDMLITSYLMCN